MKPPTLFDELSWATEVAWVMGSDASRAVDRFNSGGLAGYRAATCPGAPLRASRAEAVEDERRYRALLSVPVSDETRQQ